MRRILTKPIPVLRCRDVEEGYRDARVVILGKSHRPDISHADDMLLDIETEIGSWQIPLSVLMLAIERAVGVIQAAEAAKGASE